MVFIFIYELQYVMYLFMKVLVFISLYVIVSYVDLVNLDASFFSFFTSLKQ